jgi:hypothetical protein
VICTLPPVHDTVTVPLLADVDGFDATLMANVAVSLPDEAPENVIQLAFDVAAHVQFPEVLVIVTLDVPPDDGDDCEVDETV